MSPFYTIFSKPNQTAVWLGFCFLVGLTGCRNSRTLTPPALVRAISKNACASSRLDGVPIRFVRFGPEDTLRFTVNGSPIVLNDSSLFQLGALTTAFFAEQVEATLLANGLSFDSVALTIPTTTGNAHVLRFSDLLLHRSGIPLFPFDETRSGQDNLAAFAKTLETHDWPAEAPYRFDYLNLVLVERALQRRKLKLAPLPRTYNRYTPDLTREERSCVPGKRSAASSATGKRQFPDVFGRVSGGVATVNELVSLIQRRPPGSWEEQPSTPTAKKRKVEALPGWLRLRLDSGEPVYLSVGKTRMHGTVVAYYPYTQTGVAIASASPRRLDCLALDILRNYNEDWNRAPHHE